ncbi:MAG: peptidoglycan DD-metalloendopeptidase family protein [Lachnospiraceae bacterium]|nr:peptidoglycan DD-metalloendopeptidase family protein [Lachnospiraceae bacterium]
MRRRRRNQKKEKMLMLFSSLFVLTALTMTGVYVKERNQLNQDDYVVDLSGLRGKEEADAANKGNADDFADTSQRIPDSAVVSSRKVENPDPADDQTKAERAVFPREMELAEATLAGQQEEDETQKKPSSKEEKLVFPEGESLVWPVVGNVLINFSMDKPVYFASLQQYKVNPGIVIQAEEGQKINAAAKGRVAKIVKEEETGNTIYMDIGSGYQVIYGQLTNIQVKEGDMAEKGAYLADVAAPTKYYSVEGCNVYFALTKDGSPVDPMGKLN